MANARQMLRRRPGVRRVLSTGIQALMPRPAKVRAIALTAREREALRAEVSASRRALRVKANTRERVDQMSAASRRSAIASMRRQWSLGEKGGISGRKCHAAATARRLRRI